MSEPVNREPPQPERLLIQSDDRVKRHDVAFPMLTVAAERIPPYVELQCYGRREFLRSDLNTRSKGQHKLGVSKQAFRGMSLESDATATWTPIPAWRWHLARVTHDRSMRLAMIGLVLAALGVVIDASLDLGKVKPTVPMSAASLAVLTSIKYILQTVGLALAFWKGVLDTDR